MTNTEMLQRVNELALYLEKAETNLYHDCVANGFREIPGMAGKLANLTLTLGDDIARDEAREVRAGAPLRPPRNGSSRTPSPSSPGSTCTAPGWRTGNSASVMATAA